MRVRLNRVALPTVLMLAGALGLGGQAIAQTTGSGNSGTAGTENRGAGQGEAAGTAATPRGVGWVQQQVERLHRQLKITSAQEPAWNQFADTMLANARHTDEMYQDRSQHFETMNAVENVKNYQAIIQAEADGLAKRASSFQALYDSLAPEQKQAADWIFRYQEQRREQRYIARHNS